MFLDLYLSLYLLYTITVYYRLNMSVIFLARHIHTHKCIYTHKRKRVLYTTTHFFCFTVLLCVTSYGTVFRVYLRSGMCRVPTSPYVLSYGEILSLLTGPPFPSSSYPDPDHPPFLLLKWTFL